MEEEFKLLGVDKIAGTPYTIDIISTKFNSKIKLLIPGGKFSIRAAQEDG